MLEEMRELCIFMVCGQTLLYFQSGKKYEKICRMILELLVLAGIVGMILNFLQSIGLQKGEIEAAGGAVAGMQRSMEEALSRQLGDGEGKADLFSDISVEALVEKYTMEEIKSRYHDFAKQYGLTIDEIERDGNRLRVYVRQSFLEEETEKQELAEADKVRQIEIGKIEVGENALEKTEEEQGKSTEKQLGKGRLEDFRRQFALILAMDKERLEVVLID